MQQPCLKIIAGCNGAGKSTYSKLFSEDTVPFDYDKRFLERYRSMPDSELREQIAINKTTDEFTSELDNAFTTGRSFTFETNLMMPYPDWIITKAKNLGYRIEMYFFCLATEQLARDRVAIRVKNDGHFVDDRTIGIKWKEGIKTSTHIIQILIICFSLIIRKRLYQLYYSRWNDTTKIALF